MALTPAQARAHLLSVMARVVAVYTDAYVAGGQTRRKPARKQKPRPEVAAVARYERRLADDYREWADDLAAQLADDPDNADELIAAALLALLLLLRRRGQENLPGAVELALSRAGLPTATAAMLERLAAAIARNDEYLTNSLLPAIGERLREMLASGEWALMKLEGAAEIAGMVGAALGGFLARVGLYAGEWWHLFNESVGEAARANNSGVMAHLDPAAANSHCIECPQFHDEGGRFYESIDDYLNATSSRLPGDYLCKSNCRCWLEVVENDGERQTIVP